MLLAPLVGPTPICLAFPASPPWSPPATGPAPWPSLDLSASCAFAACPGVPFPPSDTSQGVPESALSSAASSSPTHPNSPLLCRHLHFLWVSHSTCQVCPYTWHGWELVWAPLRAKAACLTFVFLGPVPHMGRCSPRVCGRCLKVTLTLAVQWNIIQ